MLGSGGNAFLGCPRQLQCGLVFLDDIDESARRVDNGQLENVANYREDNPPSSDSGYDGSTADDHFSLARILASMTRLFLSSAGTSTPDVA